MLSFQYASMKGLVAVEPSLFYGQIVDSRGTQKVELTDLGSLHGTFLNEETAKLGEEEPRELKDGDLIRFGVSVYRGQDAFDPAKLKVGIIFGHS